MSDIGELQRLAQELETLAPGGCWEMWVDGEEGVRLRVIVEGKMWTAVLVWSALMDQPQAMVDRALAALRGALARARERGAS